MAAARHSDNRRWPALAFAVSSFLLLSGAFAFGTQRPIDRIHIGILTNAWGPPAALSHIVDGLSALGHVENEDFVIAVWFTEGDANALPQKAEEMLAAGVHVIVTVGPLEADAAAQATGELPIIFTNVGDPIEQGLIESYAQPGGNVTGIADAGFGISGRRLQLFAEMIPEMRRILLPFNITNPYQASEAEEYRRLASRLGISLLPVPFDADGGAAYLASLISDLNVDGILVPRDVDLNIPGTALEVAVNASIPSMFEIAQYVEAGGLASYGAASDAVGRQVARMIDKIARGESPAAIPVETPERMELVVNLRTATDLGLSLPPVVLFQADRTIR